MNRHRAYWSAMGPGEDPDKKVKPVNPDQYYDLLIGTFASPYRQDNFSNLVKAVKKIKEKLNL